MNLRTAWKGKKENRKKVIIYGIWFIVNLLLFYCFIYNDIMETMCVSIGFWDDLFSGRVRYFYASEWEMASFAYAKTVHATYDFPMYIIFALWNFPIWIVKHFFGVNILESLICLIWGKSLLLVFSVIFARALYRLCITLDMTRENAKLVCLLFFTSNFFMTSVIMISAYDIIALYLSIEGINFYFKDNKKGFLGCFMLAVPLKFFPLLLFVPLLLLKEKRILHVISSILLTILPILIFRLLLPARAVYGEPETVAFHIMDALKGTENDGLIYWNITANELPAALGRIYPSIFLWIICLLYCYLKKINAKEELKKQGIYCCFLMFAILFMTSKSSPYWLLFLIPLVVILMGQNYKYLYVNLLLETIFTWGLILGQILSFPWCFGNAIASGMLLSKIFGTQNTFVPITPLTVLEKLVDNNIMQGFLVGCGCSIFIAGLFLFALINFPGGKKEFVFIVNEEKNPRGMIYLRIVTGIGIACIPILLYIVGLRIG